MAEKFKKVLAMVLSLALLATFCAVPMTASAETGDDLKFGSDGKFKILIFADTQDQYPVYASLLNRMRLALEREQPDLVVFTGDQTEINTKDVEVDFRRTIERILSPVVEAGIPYAFTFGNHDPQSAYAGQITSKDAMYNVYKTIGDCRTNDPAPELTGTGTCKVPIYSSNGNNVAFNLWMVDSGSYQDPLDTSSGYDNPHKDQLDWMKANNDAGINSLVFQHIPMPETYNLFVEDANGEKTYGDKKYKLELKEGVTGKAGEFPATIYAHDNRGEFQTLKEMGNVLGVFNGHDHLNDFIGTYDGIKLASVPGMSYFNYGDEAIRGYGVIELDESDLSDFNYNSVKFTTLDAEAGVTTETVYDEYDVVEYSDLKENGNALADNYTIKGGHTFTYDATSPSYSAIFKYRWTAGSNPGYQFSFDLGADGNISHPFGVWIKRADQTPPNGAWDMKPNESKYSVKMNTAISNGETFDIEFGRLKVLSGSPKSVGQYYVYLKVNGKLIQEGYSNVDDQGMYVSGGADCHVSNVIRFGGWGNGGDDIISQYVEPVVEEYAPYDVIGYNDLLNYDTLKPLTEEGMQLVKTDYSFKYNESEEAAKTHSMIFKLRWTMETYEYFQIHLGSYGGKNNFAYRLKNDGHWQDRALDAHVAVSKRLAAGEYYDLEVARLMVTNGKNKDKYYTYLKVDGDIIFEKYVSADDENTTKYLNNVVYLGFTNDQTCFISATPEPEVEEPVEPEESDSIYAPYDLVEYEDFLDSGNHHLAADGVEFSDKNTLLHYDVTSETHSVIYKFRWVSGTATYFQMYPGVYATNPFQYRINVSDAQWVKRYAPGNETKAIGYAINQGDEFDIEIGRLKVVSGENAGKYHSYFKVNGEEIFSVYVAESETNSDSLLDSIQFATNSDGATFKIKATPKTDVEEPEEPVDPNPYSPYYEYDEITYSDLKKNGESVGAISNINSGNVFTYDATSSTYSAIFKFRWTAGNDTGIQFSFDKMNTHEISYPFGVWVKKPDDGEVGANGAWHLRPTHGNLLVKMDSPVVKGNTYDIELARLKVKNGDNAGKYYVYLKVDGKLIQETYVEINADGTYVSGSVDCMISNEIVFCDWGGYNNIISDIPVPETFEAYDEINYSDLYENGNPVGEETQLGNKTLTYNKTSSSHSVVLKYRWKPATGAQSFLSFDTRDDGGSAYMFGVQIYGANDTYPYGYIDLRPGYDGGIVALPEALQSGKNYDIEFARKKVATGANKGKYLVYFKMNDLYVEEYVDAGIDAEGKYTSNWNNLPCTVSNKVYFSNWGGGGGHKITDIPVAETYEAYDEITFDDLYEGSTSMSGLEMEGSHDYTYNATSSTYSVKFKYRWIAGGNEMKFSTYFDAWKYPFCFAVKTPNQTGFGATAGPNGSWHLVPSNDSMIVDMDEPIVAGQAYDIEIARLKVKTGKNAGKYYVYFMVDGEIVQSYYYDGVVDGAYEGTALSNNIIISAPAGNKFTAIPVVVEYEDYDVIGYEDLIDANGNPLPSNEFGVQTSVFTYNKTSPTGSAILKFRWKEANAASNFQICFDKRASVAMPYMFGIQYYVPTDELPNGKVWLRPSYGPELALENAFVTGKDYNIEIARLKVKNGPNAGKYYVYFKVNDVLIAESYVDANVVDANGNYVSNPGPENISISNEIFITFWGGGGGNKIAAYKEIDDSVVEQQGVRGDFDGDGVINATDLTVLRKILLGTYDASELPEGIADFNADGKVDLRDLVSIKKYLAPTNTYAKTGSLTLGMQEHLLEDSTKTATYIADASATLGATSYRLSTPIHQLFYANSSNEAVLRTDNMNQLKEMVAALKAKGITEILYVTDSFITPYGYGDAGKYHNITVPDPVDDVENYIAWLTVNADAFGKLASEVPEIKFFEPFNEINTTGTRMERYGIDWNATDDEKAAHKFTVEEKAVIMADLCYYISEAVKSVDSENQVTSPSIVAGSNSVIENDFLDKFYTTIESGNYPTGKVLGDMKVDNYFTIVNIHAYPDYTEDDSWLFDNFISNANKEINEWAGHINTAYNTVKAHNDGGSRVWLTETGMSTYHPDGSDREESNVAKIIELALKKIDQELTFIDNVIFYKIGDISSDIGASPSETYFGLFRSGDDLDYPYEAKPIAKTIYSYFHNNTTDYSALDALVGRYAE